MPFSFKTQGPDKLEVTSSQPPLVFNHILGPSEKELELATSVIQGLNAIAVGPRSFSDTYLGNAMKHHTKWSRRNDIRDQFHGLAGRVTDLGDNFLELMVVGRNTMKSIVSSYGDLREWINEAAAGNLTTLKVDQQRELLLKTISHKLEIFEGRIFDTFDLATKTGGATASVIEAIQEQQGTITDEKNALRLTRGFSNVVRGAVGQDTLSAIQLETLEMNMALTEQCVGTVNDVESFLGGLGANCIVLRKHVQEEGDYNNDALWSDRSAESLMKRFDERYLLIRNELQT